MSTDTGWLDREAARRNADRASATYDASAVLQARLRQQMIVRLEWIAFTPEVIVDLGCGTGHAARALGVRWPQSRVIAIDSAPGIRRGRAAGRWRALRVPGRGCARTAADRMRAWTSCSAT